MLILTLRTSGEFHALELDVLAFWVDMVTYVLAGQIQSNTKVIATTP